MSLFRRRACAVFMLLSVTATAAAPALAQTTIEIPEIVVTPLFTPTPLDKIGSSLSVINREQIERLSPASAAQLFRSIPGVTVVESGGPGGSTDIRLRGAETGQTLVLIDGVRVNDFSTTRDDFDFALLSPNDIERIEILRGPQSALYGSDAMGGVINIITRKAETGTTASAQVEGGSYGTHSEQLSAGMSAGDFRMRFSGSYYATEGFSRRGDRDEDEADGSEKWAGHFSGSYAPVDGPRVDVGVTAYNQSADYDGTSASTGPDAENRADRSMLSGFATLTMPTIGERYEQSITGFFFDSARDNHEPASTIPLSEFDATSGGAEYRGTLDLGNAGTLTGGLRAEHEAASNKAETSSDFPGYDSERTFYAGYALHQFSPTETLHLTFGGRYDGEIDGEGFLTGRATAAWQIPSTDTILRASVGTGAKRPTAYQIGNNFFAAAEFPSETVDTDLEPEKSIGVDAGIEQILGDGVISVSATGFYNHFTDLLVFTPFNCDTCSFSDGAYENIDKAETAGVELAAEADVLPGLFKMGASYTYLYSRNLDTGRALPRRPEHTASLDMTLYEAGLFEMTLSAVLVGERFNRASDTEPLPAYGRLDFYGKLHVAENTELYARIENLTDNDYQDPAGFNAPGLSAYVGVHWTH
jgi:vitamin B12 transporter